MGELYERLLGQDTLIGPKIPVDSIQAVAAEVALGKMTVAQAQTLITNTSGQPLTPTGVTEMQDLIATVTAITGTDSPGGQTAQVAARAEAIAKQATRRIEIDQVLTLVDHGAYADAAALRTRLGVPTR